MSGTRDWTAGSLVPAGELARIETMLDLVGPAIAAAPKGKPGQRFTDTATGIEYAWHPVGEEWRPFQSGWISWSGAFAGITDATGTEASRYRFVDYMVTFEAKWTFGDASPTLSLVRVNWPVSTDGEEAGIGMLAATWGRGYDASGTAEIGLLMNGNESTTTSGVLRVMDKPSSTHFAAARAVATTVPWPWTTNDVLWISGTYLP